MLRTNVNEMNVESIDLGDEVRHGVDLGLAFAPIVLVRPILREFLHRRELHALRCIRYEFSLRPLGCVNASAQVGEVRLRCLKVKWTNSGLVSCLLGGWLCSTGLGHVLLLLISFRFQIRKCLDDRPWTERGCHTQHRAHLEKATARSVIWLSHGGRSFTLL